MGAARERVSQAWRDLHESVYYAADITGCAQFIQFADHQARRSDAAADIEVLRCIYKAGRLTGDEVLQYQHLHAHYIDLVRAADGSFPTDVINQFVEAAQELEERIWQVVPNEKLPSGMVTRSTDPQTGQLGTIRKSRRSAKF